MSKLLEVNNLHTYFRTKRGNIKAVNDASFSIEKGKTLGIVGESGSGKSVTSMSVLRILDHPGYIHSGSIMFDGKEITELTEEEMRQIRGNDISMIFQEPMTSLNPVFKIGRQIGEVLRLHKGMTKAEARQKSIEMLDAVGIPRPEEIVDNYSFQLSGGMRQRAMIAMALACEPKLLIADEPTTALDVTIQAQILVLMNDLKHKFGTSILFITHDLGVISEMADDVVVMYAGQVVESAPMKKIFDEGLYSHPYTEGLLKSIPSIEDNKDRLDVIEGSVPHPLNLPVGCKFSPRCKYATSKCFTEEPELISVAKDQQIRCFYPKKGER
ncbi:peptide ABC transporter ATP-binding protein [Candidatus Izimaplasma bacterium ZiA1]|uniref:ABC transporter ATP-binding protein n=1 Tax=Candidatus Izimoplasma sp. ZiA1 TaxID=2024899 RepID=UPI000BAA8580|nr:peptide ABC transporter ATP-binding protein [Candidatus Izimaplasma bacterium ZiA1]